MKKLYTVIFDYHATGEGMIKEFLVTYANDSDHAVNIFKEMFFVGEWDFIEKGIVVEEGVSDSLKHFISEKMFNYLKEINCIKTFHFSYHLNCS